MHTNSVESLYTDKERFVRWILLYNQIELFKLKFWLVNFNLAGKAGAYQSEATYGTPL
jgi:hypothetical protein